MFVDVQGIRVNPNRISHIEWHSGSDTKIASIHLRSDDGLVHHKPVTFSCHTDAQFQVFMKALDEAAWRTAPRQFVEIGNTIYRESDILAIDTRASIVDATKSYLQFCEQLWKMYKDLQTLKYKFSWQSLLGNPSPDFTKASLDLASKQISSAGRLVASHGSTANRRHLGHLNILDEMTDHDYTYLRLVLIERAGNDDVKETLKGELDIHRRYVYGSEYQRRYKKLNQVLNYLDLNHGVPTYFAKDSRICTYTVGNQKAYMVRHTRSLDNLSELTIPVSC